MKKLIIIIFLPLIFPSISYSEQIKIFDKVEIYEKKVFVEVEGKYVPSNFFKTIGSSKTKSSLKLSKAELIDCPKNISDKVSKEFRTSKLSKKIADFYEFTLNKCIRISYKNLQTYIVNFEIEINITNTKYKPINENIIWIGSIGKTGLINEVYFEISENRFFKDNMYNINLKAVADINNDEQHEIIIDKMGYGGNTFFVFEYEEGQLVKTEISGEFWD